MPLFPKLLTLTLPPALHACRLQLARELLSTVGAGWAGRVFYTDDGSTAVEVALKMAFRKFMVDHGLLDEGGTELEVSAEACTVGGMAARRLEQSCGRSACSNLSDGSQHSRHVLTLSHYATHRQANLCHTASEPPGCLPLNRSPPAHLATQQVLGLTEGYHGDTLGAMDAVSPSPFNGRMQTPWYTGRGLFLEPPTVVLQQGAWRVSLPPDMVAATEEAAALAAAVLPGARQKPFATQCGSREAVFALEQRMQAAGGEGAAQVAGETAATASLYPFYLRYIQQQLDDYEAAQQQRLEASGSSSTSDATAGEAQQQQQQRRRVLGACIVEPVLQGAGGMRLIDPLYQRALVEVCRQVVAAVGCGSLQASVCAASRGWPHGCFSPYPAVPTVLHSPSQGHVSASLAGRTLLLSSAPLRRRCHMCRERRIPVIFYDVFTSLPAAQLSLQPYAITICAGSAASP